MAHRHFLLNERDELRTKLRDTAKNTQTEREVWRARLWRIEADLRR